MDAQGGRKKNPGREKSAPERTGAQLSPFQAGLRVPPQSLDTERALLGSLMLNSNAMYEVADIVRAESFYSPQNQKIYDAMLSIYSKGNAIDLVTVSNRLKETDDMSAVGGATYLSELIATAASPGSAKHYAEIVQSKFLLRSLIMAGYDIQEMGFQEARDINEILSDAEKKVFEVANAPTMRSFSVIKDELHEAWERLELLQKSDDSIRGVPSGFPALDNMLSGFQKSDLIILAARPSMGKTALALDIARQSAVKHGTSVGIFSIEMSAQSLVDRMLAAESRVDSWKIRTGKIRADRDFEALQHAMEKLSDAPIFIDDQPGATILSMRSVGRRLKLEKNLGLIIVDYLQLITPTSTKASDSMVQQVTEISRSLKAMARELEVPVIALSQLSRAIEQRRGRPKLSDLRDSGSIEQDADVVIFIHREDKMNSDMGVERTDIAEILVEKHRNGPTGKVELKYDGEHTTFLPIEKSDFGDFAAAAPQSNDQPF